jgi:uncharacterized protein (DUF924 family)
VSLTIFLPTHRHSQTPTCSLARSSQTALTSSTGCYATDPAALDAADRAIEKGYDRQVDPDLRRFYSSPRRQGAALDLIQMA